MTTSHQTQLTPGEVTRIKEVFGQFDEDGDGAIATKEVAPVLRVLGINIGDSELGDLLDEADIERKGPVDFPEFVTLVTMLSPHLKNQPQEDAPNEK